MLAVDLEWRKDRRKNKNKNEILKTCRDFRDLYRAREEMSEKMKDFTKKFQFRKSFHEPCRD